jgi:AraC-like DNA-binding protein
MAPGERLDAWNHAARTTLGPLDMRVHSDGPLWGEIVTERLGAVTVARVHTTTPHSVHRTPGLIRQDSPEFYRVVLPIAGGHHLTQNDRSSWLKAGEFTLYDFTRPYEIGYVAPVELAVFTFPHTQLPFSRDAIADLIASPVPPGSGAAGLVAPLLGKIAADLDSYQPATAARLSTILLDLIGAAVAERVDPGSPVLTEARQRTLLFRIHAFIEANLADPELSPAGIAAAQHISLRYLHRLFAAEQTTVGGWIRARRLERCRRDLTEPTSLLLPVSAIGARWGLTDSAHFSRVFRSAYGLPPTGYRQTCLAGG